MATTRGVVNVRREPTRGSDERARAARSVCLENVLIVKSQSAVFSDQIQAGHGTVQCPAL